MAHRNRKYIPCLNGPLLFASYPFSRTLALRTCDSYRDATKQSRICIEGLAEQVIIEFVGDTTNLEEAYNKLEEQVSSAGNLNEENATGFKKANAEIS